ncbi:hypothetical protein MKX01_032427 [Papaver californicum]|nr:hypothetical protein MKX01_032427 [Papaver californicum]
MAELGGSGPESMTKPNSAVPLLGSGSKSSGSVPPWASGNNSGGGGIGSVTQPGLVINGAKTRKDYDDTNFYIGYLPPNLDDNSLIRLFQPFSDIVMDKVIKDRATNVSKGYSFVNQAIATMNG